MGNALDRQSMERFKGELSSAIRTTAEADDALARRFVELRPGAVAALSAPVNHLLTGRRGVGKSTTLALLQRKAEEDGDRVVFVDVETHKDRSYPDVLIEIVLEVLEKVAPNKKQYKHRHLRRSMAHVTQILQFLLESADEVVEVNIDNESNTRATGVELSGYLERNFLSLKGGYRRDRNTRRTRSRTSTRTRSKETYLRDLAPSIARLLSQCTEVASKKKLHLVLDDFYFIATDTQPLVLDHLHGITKRSNVWLKIGSVHSRTRAYIEGDPPRGMQPPNDLQHLSLDVGLADFVTAKNFLEDVANGVLEPLGLEIKDVMTETARERAVLICGGAVPRDYFDVLITAADFEWESIQKKEKPDETFRIGAESIQAAASRTLDRKQTDLKNDAGREVRQLEDRFADLVKFVRNRKTYFFLVKKSDFDSGWGREIVQLEDLRFVHRIKTTRPNSEAMRGIDTVVFMVDIPSIVDTRMQKLPVEFWKPGKADLLRKAAWVYEENWTEITQSEKTVKGEARTPQKADTAYPGAATLFDDL